MKINNNDGIDNLDTLGEEGGGYGREEEPQQTDMIADIRGSNTEGGIANVVDEPHLATIPSVPIKTAVTQNPVGSVRQKGGIRDVIDEPDSKIPSVSIKTPIVRTPFGPSRQKGGITDVVNEPDLVTIHPSTSIEESPKLATIPRVSIKEAPELVTIPSITTKAIIRPPFGPMKQNYKVHK